jgi:hypothetical protein
MEDCMWRLIKGSSRVAEPTNFETGKTFFDPGIPTKRRIELYRREVGAKTLSEALRRLVDEGLTAAGIPRIAEPSKLPEA